jgi:hypothetical protein
VVRLEVLLESQHHFRHMRRVGSVGWISQGGGGGRAARQMRRGDDGVARSRDAIAVQVRLEVGKVVGRAEAGWLAGCVDQGLDRKSSLSRGGEVGASQRGQLNVDDWEQIQ